MMQGKSIPAGLAGSNLGRSEVFWNKEGRPMWLELKDKLGKFVRSQITRALVGQGESEFKMALDID